MKKHRDVECLGFWGSHAIGWHISNVHGGAGFGGSSGGRSTGCTCVADSNGNALNPNPM